MNPGLQAFELVTRRHFLGRATSLFGAAAFSSLLQNDRGPQPIVNQTDNPFAPTAPMFSPRAKRVIYLHMAGSPPQQELFDWKPRLRELDGSPCPDELYLNERFAFIKGRPNMLGPQVEFERCGRSGTWVSDHLPHFKSVVDEVTIVKSLYTDQFNHAPAQLLLYTGAPRLGRPSMGSWATYGLGSLNQNLPAFVVLVSGGKKPAAGKSVWGSGFLPSVYQGVQCRASGDPVLYVSDPPGMDRETRRQTLDAINELNHARYEQLGDPETLTRIAQYELAYRMQMSVPEAMDITREPQDVLEMYGASPGEASLANNCLLARRLVEHGVRFVQLFDWGWDTHGTSPGDDLMNQLPAKCKQMDRPVTALLQDLKRRGLLDETLVVWSGEFGRTAMNEERNGSKFLGRDHHPHCMTIWMAGGGVRRGYVHGETNELGYRVSKDPIHIHDLQATILHLLGMDHEGLTHRFQGRDFRLTDVHGHVVHDLLT